MSRGVAIKQDGLTHLGIIFDSEANVYDVIDGCIEENTGSDLVSV